MQKNHCENGKNPDDTRQRERCDSYSILFNLCGSPGFYHRNQNERNLVRLSLMRFWLKKLHFFMLFYANWEEIESLKKEKSPGIVLEKSWNSVIPFL